jgi:class 3 adenylate cyclase
MAAFVLLQKPLPGWNVGLLSAMAGAAFVGGLLLFATADHVGIAAMQAITAFATVYIGAVQYFALPGGLSFGLVLLLWPILWAFTYLPFYKAARISILAVTVLGVVLGSQEGWPNPLLWGVFLTCTFVVTAVTMTLLVRRAELANQQLHEFNATLEHRVAEQVAEMDRLGRLRRFLSPQVADAVIGTDGEDLEFHRREIAVIFIDLRGFTSFAAEASPEDVTTVLSEYYAVVGKLTDTFAATVGAFAGDGVMLYFNDPLPCEDPCNVAVKFAIELRNPMDELSQRWARRGLSIGHGVGIAFGYATVGMTGFGSRADYTALGPVVNLASRLCDEAAAGEILLDQRANAAVEHRIATEPAGVHELKGFSKPVTPYRVVGQ